MSRFLVFAAAAGIVVATASAADAGARERPPPNGLNGLSLNGLSLNGLSLNGVSRGEAAEKATIKRLILKDGTQVILN